MKASEVNIIVTNSYAPEWTRRAIASIRTYYPHNRIIVVDDQFKNCENELLAIKQQFDVELLFNPERRGAGRAIDLGFRHARGDWVLTSDHGVTLGREGLVEYFLQLTGDDIIGIGQSLHNRCAKRLAGRFVSCALGLWNHLLIQKHDLSFKLTGMILPGGEPVAGCTTGQYLCYRALKLGYRQQFVNLRSWHYHEHARGQFPGRLQSTHELTYIKEGEIDF